MTIKRFNFEDFTEGQAGEVIKASVAAPAPQPVQVEPPAAALLGAEDVEQARTEGFAEGKAEGYKEGKEEVQSAWDAAKNAEQTLLATLLESLHTKINALFSSIESGVSLPKPEILAMLSLEIAKKIAGEALEANASADIDAFIRRSLDQLFDEPKLTLYVAGPLCDPLRHRIELLSAEQNFHGSLYVQPDPLLGATDCRIEWHDGYICHSRAEITAQIEKILNISQDNTSPGQALPTEMFPQGN